MSKKVLNLAGHKVTPTEEEFAYSDEIHATFIEPPKVPVSIFKEQFFDGLRKQDKDVRNKWIDKINNMYGRVNLIDENDEVVTWVPPMAYGLVSKNSNKLDEAAYTHRATKENFFWNASCRTLILRTETAYSSRSTGRSRCV